ncbi:hypothetical protein EOA35_18040, partial [Mesorhizobium sp. M8A.F.Ca.ET.023.01.1.1]
MPMISSLSSRERRRSRIFLLAAALAAMPVLGGAHADDAVRQVLPSGQPTVAPQQLTREKAPDQSEIERFCS